MKSNLDATLLFIASFLIGGLTFSSIVSELDTQKIGLFVQTTIAMTAIYAVSSWKRQHKYTSYESDKDKTIEKTTSLLTSTIKLSRKCCMAYSLRALHLEKTGRDYATDGGLVRRIESCWIELDDKIHELQVEAKRNQFINDNLELKKQIFKLLIKSSELVDKTVKLLALTEKNISEPSAEKAKLLREQSDEIANITNEATKIFDDIIF